MISRAVLDTTHMHTNQPSELKSGNNSVKWMFFQTMNLTPKQSTTIGPTDVEQDQ